MIYAILVVIITVQTILLGVLFWQKKYTIPLSLEKWALNYRKNPKYFWGWLIMTLIFGLFGFWCPIIYNVVAETKFSIGEIILQGSLSTFSIVVLLDGIIIDRSLPKDQRANFLVSAIAMILIAFHILFYAFTIFGVKTFTIKFVILLLSIAAIFMAILLFQYKKVEEDSVESMLESQRAEIQEAAEATMSNNPIV